MKKDKTMTMIGTVMAAGGIPIVLIWMSMLFIGRMVNEEIPLFFTVFIILGAVGAFVGLANGVMIIRSNDSTKMLQTIFAAVTALFSLPGGFMFLQMNWFFAMVPVVLFGFGPSAYYLVRIYDAYNERRM